MAFWVGVSAEPSPRDVLGVGPRATAEEIRLAYKKRALECHPDKGGDPDMFVKVRNAYEVLKAAGSTVTAQLFSQIPQRAPNGYKTPFPYPSTNLQSTAQEQSASSVRSESSLNAASPKKRMKRTIQQEINSAFASLPSSLKRPKKSVPVAKPAALPPGLPSSQSSAVADALKRLQAMPVEKLWEILAQMDVLERERAINLLPLELRANLGAFLRAKQQSRDHADMVHSQPVAGDCDAELDSTSSSSSSSTSSSSSSEEDVNPHAFSKPLNSRRGAVSQKVVQGSVGIELSQE